MSLTLEQLCIILNREFGPPFLIENGVSAEVRTDDEGTKTLSITIGRRDIEIDETGEIVGAGTFIQMADYTLLFNNEE